MGWGGAGRFRNCASPCYAPVFKSGTQIVRETSASHQLSTTDSIPYKTFI